MKLCRFIYDSVITVRNMKNMQNMKETKRKRERERGMQKGKRIRAA